MKSGCFAIDAPGFRSCERIAPSCFAGVNPLVAGTPSTVQGLAQERVDERRRLERREVVGTFAQADKLDRHSQLLLNAENDAALGRAVQFGQYDAGDVDHFSEDAGLRQAVLTDRRVQD